MSYRKILVPLTGGERDGSVLNSAFEVAAAFESHVAGVYVKPDPSEVLPYLGEGVSAGVVQEIMDTAQAASARASAAALATMERIAKDAKAPVSRPGHAAAGLGASFLTREGPIVDIICEETRLSDLVVFELPSEAKDGGSRATLEAALVNGRKPLLLTPRVPAPIVGQKIAIGWDGSAPASAAVTAAMPLLKKASAIEIVNVTTGAMDVAVMDRLRDYLRLHGLQAAEHGINPGGQGTAETLIGGAERAGAKLLVLGGYGHSWLREFLFGGVTRHVLANANLPIFMAH